MRIGVFFLSIHYYYINYHECAAIEPPPILTTREKIIKYYFPIRNEYTHELDEIKVIKYDKFDDFLNFIAIIFEKISTNYYLERYN